MKAKNMKQHILYRAITGSPDGTIEAGQTVILSGGKLFSEYKGIGIWLEPEQWKSPEIVNFEVEKVKNP